MMEIRISPLRRVDPGGDPIPKFHWWLVGAVLSWLIVVGLAMLVAEAFAHEAPTGWTYPWSCCADQDCRPVAEEDIREGPDGYLIVGTGEVVPYRDERVKDSPDGLFHWCAGGEDKTICLFRPPRGF